MARIDLCVKFEKLLDIVYGYRGIRRVINQNEHIEKNHDDTPNLRKMCHFFKNKGTYTLTKMPYKKLEWLK